MVEREVQGRVEWETMGIRIGGGGSGRPGCSNLCTQRPRLQRWRSAAGAGRSGGGGGERGDAEEGRSWSPKAGRGEMGEELLGRGVCGEELLRREAGAGEERGGRGMGVWGREPRAQEGFR